MKKLFSFVLAMLLGICCAATLAACGKKSKDPTPSTSDADILETALTQVRALYSDKAEETPENYTVVGQVKVPAGTYAITWTSSSPNAVVGVMNATNKQVPITITRAEVDVPYILKAEITVGEETGNVQFNRKIPKAIIGGDVIYDLSSVTETGTALNGSTARDLLNGLTTTAELTDVSVTSVYAGNGSGGGTYQNSGGLLKLGTGSAHGVLTLTFAKQVKKVAIEAQGWPNEETTLAVNDGEAQTLSNAAKLVHIYEFDSTNTVKIETANRGFIFQIVVYYDKDVHNHAWSYTHDEGAWTHTKTCTADGCDLTGDAATVVEACTPDYNVCRFCEEEYTSEQILDALFGLETNAKLPGTYKLTGVITKVVEIQTADFKNCTFWMKVDDKHEAIEAYRAVGENYETIAVGCTVTVTGELKKYNSTYEFDQGCTIISIEDTRTDAQKVQSALDAVKDTMTIEEAGNVPLATSSVDGVTLTWELVSGTAATLNAAKDTLQVEALPAETATVVLKVTATLDSDSTVTVNKQVTVTIKSEDDLKVQHAGTAEDPFSVEDAIKIASGLESGAYYKDKTKVWVKGYVTNSPANRNDGKGLYQVFISDTKGDTSNRFQVYFTVWNDVVPEGSVLKAGDEIVACAFITNYNGKYELTGTSDDPAVITVWTKAEDVKPDPDAHVCEHVCPVCGKCEDTECTETECEAKCEGHTLPQTAFPATDIDELNALVPNTGDITTQKYYALGYVKSITDQYNALIVLVDDDGNELTISALFNENGTTRNQEPSKTFSKGDAIVVYGVMNNYNGTKQMLNAWLVQVNSEAKTNVAAILLADTTLLAQVTNDFELPTAGGKITWAVTSGTGIAIEGTTAKVTRTAEDQTVVLTATANVDGVTATKTFTVKVLLKVAGQDLLVLMADNLLAGTSTEAYHASGNATIDGYAFSWIGMGHYAWMQMRTNTSTGTSSFWNTEALGGNIIKVVFTWSASNNVPNGKTENLKVEFANDVAFTNAKSQTITFTNTAKTVEVVPDGNYKYIRVTHNNQGAVYLDDVKISFNTPSDADIVAAEKAKVEAAIEDLKSLFNAVDENVTLPTASKGVAIDWAVTSGDATLVEIADGKLTIKALPATENAKLTVTGTLTLNDANATVTYAIEIVSSAGDSRTDAEKVASALEDLELDKNVLENADDYIELPAKAGEVNFAWSIVKEADKAYVEISEGKLVVKALPATDTQVELKVVATCGSASDDDTVTVTVKANPALKYGSAEHPLSVAAALALAAEECKTSGSYTAQVVYAKGIALTTPTKNTSYYNQFDLGDSADHTTKIIVYTITVNGDLAAPAQNDEVVIYGYITNYNGTLEFSTKDKTIYVYLYSNTRGTSTITLGAHEGADVAGLPESKLNGEVVEFTVTAQSGKVLEAVKLNGEALTEANGKYSFTVAGNATITVETHDEGVAAAEVLTTLDFSKATYNKYVNNYTSSYTATIDSIVWNISCFNNGQASSGWSDIRTGRNGAACESTIATNVAWPDTVTKVIVNVSSLANADKVKSFRLEVSSNGQFTEADIVATVSLTMAEGNNEFVITNPVENHYYRIVIDCVAGTANGFVRISKVTYVGYAAEGGVTNPDTALVNAGKVAAAKDAFELEVIQYSAVEENIQLSNESGDVTLTWSVKNAAEEAEWVTVTENVMAIKKLPDEGEHEITLKVVFTLGDATAEKEFVITLLPSNAKGTLNNPYTVAEALEVIKALPSGGYTDAPVHVTGYVVDAGGWNDSYGNFTNVYIADSPSSTKASADALQVFRLYPDGEVVKVQADLKLGATIVALGYLQNYNGNTPEMTYKGSDNPVIVTYTAPTDEAKVAIALAALNDTLPNVSTAEDVTLPKSTVDGVTFAWTSSDSTYTVANEDGWKLKVAALPTEDTKVTLTVTATCGEFTTGRTKTVEVTIKAPSSGDEDVVDITFDFSFNTTAATSHLNSSDLTGYFKDAGKTPTDFTSASCTDEASKSGLFKGDSTKGAGTLKMGTSSISAATFDLIFAKEVKKVVITWFGWSGTEGKLTVNGKTSPNFQASAAAEEFELSAAATTVTITATKRVLISKIEIYFA